jgi:hypothetical protein
LNYLEEEPPENYRRHGLSVGSSIRLNPSLQHAGLSSFAYTRTGELTLFNLSVEEFFPVSPYQELTFARQEFKPLAYFVILLGIYITKLVFLLYFRPVSR